MSSFYGGGGGGSTDSGGSSTVISVTESTSDEYSKIYYILQDNVPVGTIYIPKDSGVQSVTAGSIKGTINVDGVEIFIYGLNEGAFMSEQELVDAVLASIENEGNTYALTDEDKSDIANLVYTMFENGDEVSY